MNVANKGIIRKLTIRFLKAGKTRNIIAIIAIILTAVMFTSVFTLGAGIVASTQEHTMRMTGGSAHGSLKCITMEQYEHFAQSPLLKDISYSRLLGLAVNEAMKEIPCELRHAEDKFAEWTFAFPSVGRMPQEKNEISCSTNVLNTLGIPHEIGALVPLEFIAGVSEYSDTFILSGFWEGDPVNPGELAWLSEEYVSMILAESVIDEDDIYTGSIFADVLFSNTFDITEKMIRLIDERGYLKIDEEGNEYSDISVGVNWAYIGNDINLDFTTVAIAVLVLALILIAGYLIIYSIFIISVNTDIHFYGLLKTIGTTGKQIRNIIRSQSMALSAVGIPAGLLFGYFIGVKLSPYVIGLMSIDYSIKTIVNPFIFIFAAVFSMLTVFMGCHKPGKIAASVSPIEAVKYSGTATSKKKSKKTRKVTPFSMAGSNIIREKRKLSVIVLSISLALILLNSAFSAADSFDLEAYLSESIISDFAVAHYSIFRPSVYDKVSGVSQEFLEEARSRGADDISNIYYYELFYHGDEEGIQMAQIYGMGKKELELFSDTDYEKLSSGNYIIVAKDVRGTGEYDDIVTVPEIGEFLTITNDRGVARDFEVIGLVDSYPHHISARVYMGNALVIFTGDDIFLDFFEGFMPMQTNINVKEENMIEFESWLADYTTTQDSNLNYISRNTLKEELDGVRTTYIMLGGAMSFILALIGILNFINTIVTSIIARRRELAMLQSIGMTGKQMRFTLMYEGIFYTLLTMLLTLTAGYGIGRLIVKVITGQSWFFEQNFTIIPSLLCIIPLILVCVIVPLACYKWLVRESLIERLRVE